MSYTERQGQRYTNLTKISGKLPEEPDGYLKHHGQGRIAAWCGHHWKEYALG